MSYWSIIVPHETTNYITNPSFEGTNGSKAPLAGWNGGSIISNGYSSAVFGFNSVLSTYKKEQSTSRILISASNAALTLEANSQYVFSAHVNAPTDWGGSGIYVSAVDFTGASVDKKVVYADNDFGSWKRIYSVVTTGSDPTGLFSILFETAPTDSKGVYIDGVMVEPGSRISTYIDGDQDGCYWAGYKNRSPSKRYPDDPRGGYVYSFANDLKLPISEHMGIGAAPVVNQFQKQALSDGQNYQGTKLGDRNGIVLAGTFSDQSTRVNLHTTRAGLVRAVNSRTRNITDGESPRRLIYSGASTTKRFDAVYTGGLELNGDQAFSETVAMRFTAPEPLMYDVLNRSRELDTSGSITTNGVIGRVNGLWSNLGLSTISALTGCSALAVDDEYAYIGGDFTNAGGSGYNYLVRYNYRTGQLKNMGGNPDGSVLALHVSANGDIYAGGRFNSINSVAADGLAKWNPVTETWSAVGGTSVTGGTAVYTIAEDSTGRLWIGGTFNNWNGSGALDFLARYNGSTWDIPGAFNNTVWKIVIDKKDNAWVGGQFTTGAGIIATRVVKIDKDDNATAIGDGATDTVRAIAVAPDGTVYFGGDFTTFDGVSVNYLAQYNGVNIAPVTTPGPNGQVYALAIDSNGNILAGGGFTSIDNSSLQQRAAFFNGSVWSPLDIDLPGTPVVRDVAISRKNDVYLGYTTTGTTLISASTEIPYTGTEYGYPVITIDNSANTTQATVKNIENITTGAVIYIDYAVAPGDVLTIDFRPNSRGMRSNKFGNVSGNILANSDVSSFYLVPSNKDRISVNVIKTFITGATPAAFITWTNTFNGVDD